MRLPFFVSLLLLAAVPRPAFAQEDLEAEMKELSWVGFQQFQEASRVFLRTTEPVKYRISQPRPSLVVVTLENTRIGVANHANFLDTRFFDSPVAFIQPKVIEGPSPSVQIEITLRKKVTFKETQNDTVLAIDFPREAAAGE